MSHNITVSYGFFIHFYFPFKKNLRRLLLFISLGTCGSFTKSFLPEQTHDLPSPSQLFADNTRSHEIIHTELGHKHLSKGRYARAQTQGKHFWTGVNCHQTKTEIHSMKRELRSYKITSVVETNVVSRKNHLCAHQFSVSLFQFFSTVVKSNKFLYILYLLL